TPTMIVALMIRGMGMGFLFLALTLFALGALKGSTNTQGVALFTTHRQFGGIFSVAVLQRYIDRQNALNEMVVSSHLNEGGTELAWRLQRIGDSLYAAGMEKGDAAKAAMAMVKRSMQAQVSVLSYNEAFLAIALFFAVAVPIIISFRIWLARRHRTGI
ncbi:hypothetical protein LJC19_02595, partial [Oxalobacter sp. OttesenSCG-928-P03]|nr:hypothetical protein [Oxalobacter sp. OttesenSCG-928-P03]